MRASRWVAALLFAAGAVAVIEAQPPGGGFGGRGFGGGGVNTQVLSNAALQAELKVTADQKEKLRPLAEQQQALQKRGMEIFKEAAGDQDKMKELFAENGEKMQKFGEEVKKALDDTLTADQKTRLKQIERQLAGVRAFGNDEVVADLKLNDSQKTKIKTIVDEFGKDSRELLGAGGGFGKGGFDKEKMAEVAKKREKLEKGAMDDIDEVLTADQRKTWKDMTGAPFDRTKIGGGFGGFGLPGGFGGKGKQPAIKD